MNGVYVRPVFVQKRDLVRVYAESCFYKQPVLSEKGGKLLAEGGFERKAAPFRKKLKRLLLRERKLLNFSHRFERFVH